LRLARTAGPDDVRLSDFEPVFLCQAKDADVRPDFDWDRKSTAFRKDRQWLIAV
jgi:hypothetical protein